MIAIVDKDDVGLPTLRDAIDDLDPSVAESLLELPTVRTLAAQADRGDVDAETVEATIDALSDLLHHPQSSVHRIAALSGVVLAEAEPEVADRILDRLALLLGETVTERRAMEAIEYLATAAPDAVADRRSVALDRLNHPRDGIARHAAGTLLAVGTASPDCLVDEVPRLLTSLTEEFEPVTPDPRSDHGDNVQELERHSRIEHESSRLIVARVVAAVAEARPEAVADAVVESEATDVLPSLFRDQQSTVRAAAVGVASHVAELEPETVEEAVPELIELLDDENETVRGGAIWTLGALDHPRATEGLRTASEDDPSEDLRELAAAVGSGDEPKLT